MTRATIADGSALPSLYKVTGPAGEAVSGGSGAWPLPSEDGTVPGAWLTVDGALVACHNGLHLTTAEHLGSWGGNRDGNVVWRAEVHPNAVAETRDVGGKWLTRTARLTGRPLHVPQVTVRLERMQAARDRANKRAAREYSRAVAGIPSGILGYLETIETRELPDGHPLREMARVRGDAVKRLTAANRAADVEFDRAYRRAYDRALRAAMRAVTAEKRELSAIISNGARA